MNHTPPYAADDNDKKQKNDNGSMFYIHVKGEYIELSRKEFILLLANMNAQAFAELSKGGEK